MRVTDDQFIKYLGNLTTFKVGAGNHWLSDCKHSLKRCGGGALYIMSPPFWWGRVPVSLRETAPMDLAFLFFCIVPPKLGQIDFATSKKQRFVISITKYHWVPSIFETSATGLPLLPCLYYLFFAFFLHTKRADGTIRNCQFKWKVIRTRYKIVPCI